VVDIEKLVFFEYADFKWFDETFVHSQQYLHLMSPEKIMEWSSYLNPAVKAKLPIEKKREKRNQETNLKQKKLPEIMVKWFETRSQRVGECTVLKNKYLIDNRLFKKEWLKIADFDACSEEAVEAFIFILYKKCFYFRSFETAKLLKDCGLTGEYEFWIISRAAKDREIKNELSWLQDLPEGITIPQDIMNSICSNFVDRSANKKRLRNVSPLRLQQLLGNNRLWANPESLWRCLESYVERYDTEEEKKAFFNGLGNAMQPKSCPQFCNLLKEKGVLSQKQWFDLNTERAKMRNYAKPPYKTTKFEQSVYCLGRNREEFTLLSPEGIECTFAYLQKVNRCNGYHGPYDEIKCELIYVEGPPCKVNYLTTKSDHRWIEPITEGMKIYLATFSIPQYGPISSEDRSITFIVEKWGD
jgi:hypothetical protein